MTLTAKTIVKNKIWIITDGKSKLGNITAVRDEFHLSLGNMIQRYSTADSIEKELHIRFDRSVDRSDRTENSLVDVRRKIHLFTKSEDSKSYHARGYFCIKVHKNWRIVDCPKYIMIQRYQYHGPFLTEEEASSILKTLE